MRLYAPNDIPQVIAGSTFRQSRFQVVIACALLWLLLAALPLAALIMTRPSYWIGVPGLVYVALVTRGVVRWASAAYRASNWSLRIAPDGIWINLRSYQNYRFPAAPVVLFVPYAEIASVAEHSVKRSEKIGGSRNNSKWTDRYLDIRLHEPASPELAAATSEERLRKVTREFLNTGLKSHSRTNHVPVTLPTETIIRVAWRGRHDCVVPNLATALKELAAHCRVDIASERSLENLDALTPAQLDGLILERASQGDKLGAIELLREKRGYSLTDAKNFVDGLTARV